MQASSRDDKDHDKYRQNYKIICTNTKANTKTKYKKDKAYQL